mgnify:CR=1 FL=1
MDLGLPGQKKAAGGILELNKKTLIQIDPKEAADKLSRMQDVDLNNLSSVLGQTGVQSSIFSLTEKKMLQFQSHFALLRAFVEQVVTKFPLMEESSFRVY